MINPDEFPSTIDHELMRSVAMELFDRSLAERDSALMNGFLERQLMSDPPRLDLLRGIAEDIQGRMHTYRTRRFDLRTQLIRESQDLTGVDLTPLFPPDALGNLHETNRHTVLTFLQGHAVIPDDILAILSSRLGDSISEARRVRDELDLATEIYRLLTDWFEAFSATVARRYWGTDTPRKETHQ